MPDAIKNIDAETILKIHKEEIYLEEDELKDKLKQECNGSRRNERCKINKQIKDKNLEWKYQLSLLQFSKDQLQESCWDKLRVLRNKCKVLEEKQKQTEEWNQIQLSQKIKEEIPKLTDNRIKELEDLLESNKRVNERLFNDVNEANKTLQGFKEGVSREKYEDLLNKYTDLLAESQKNKGSNNKSSNTKNDKDDGFKQKFLDCKKENIELKKQITSLEEENLQLLTCQ